MAIFYNILFHFLKFVSILVNKITGYYYLLFFWGGEGGSALRTVPSSRLRLAESVSYFVMTAAI